MLRVDFTNIMSSSVSDQHGIAEADAADLASKTTKAHAVFSRWRESKDAIFFDMVSDSQIAAGIMEEAHRTSEDFENVVVLGIGGSALGLRCAAQALLLPFWNLRDDKARSHRPRLFVMDNIDPDSFSALLAELDIKRTRFVVISKSGKTTETAAQFFIVLEKLRKAVGGSWQKNMAIITDPKDGDLRPFANKEGVVSFPIHPKLGGRYSVLSAVGLFPAACVGIDIGGLLSGAKAMAKRCGEPDMERNIAYRIGGYHHHLERTKGKSISVMMPYSDGLSVASEWYAQLWAESLGKGGLGQTPVKALGTTDQHSQVQLYMDGPNDKVFTFLRVESFRSGARDTTVGSPSDHFGYLKGKGLGEILNAEQEATAGALAQAKRPNITVSFPTLDAHHLGEFFMLYEISTAFAGALYGINPFDQPGVELGKKLTREILSKG
jgi:glucose-6-phosphate isomerase